MPVVRVRVRRRAPLRHGHPMTWAWGALVGVVLAAVAVAAALEARDRRRDRGQSCDRYNRCESCGEGS